MKGEKELVENILNTEINIFSAIRDGSALMQHMEDFYYISLLEVIPTFINMPTFTRRVFFFCCMSVSSDPIISLESQKVRSNYKSIGGSQPPAEKKLSA